MNKCIKVAIKNCKELDYKVMSEKLRNIQYLTCKASNKAMQMYYMWENQKIDIKNKTGEYPNDKELFGKTYRNVVEGEMKTIMNTINTSNVGQTNAIIMKKWNTDKKEVLSYQKSLPNFKLNMPIYIKNKSFSIVKGTSGYEIICSIFNKSQDLKRLTFIIDKLDGNKKATLNKIIDLTNKQGAGQIIKDRKGKWYFIISFGFENKKRELDINRILGIDVGITNLLTMQIWDCNLKEWDRLAWNSCMVDGRELMHYRQKIEARRKSLLKNSKISEKNTGKAGHGISKRIQAIDVVRNKEKNFRDTFNHKYSRYAVDFAIRNNCGIIQMENLAKFTEEVKEKMLKNWSYYDLQSKIKYKAEEQGIKVNFIKPSYTSKRCSLCGAIDDRNRDCKNNQSKFQCVVCDHKEHADINAAKNIALPDIEELIESKIG